MVKKEVFFTEIFCNGREHIAFSHGQKLLSNQFQHNLHFIVDKESMKEHTLVRFPLISLKCEASESVQFSTCHEPIHRF